MNVVPPTSPIDTLARETEPIQPHKEASMGRPASPWQFSLGGLFLATTLVAVVVAAGLAISWGAAMLTLVLALAALNCWGSFERFESASNRRWVFRSAWILFATSMFLPTAKGCNSTVLYGWETARACVLYEVELIGKSANTNEAEPVWKRLLAIHCFSQLNAANFLMLGSPLLLVRLNKDRGQRYSTLFLWAILGIPSLSLNGDMGLIGYYAWFLSFVILLTILRIGWRRWSILAMLAIGNAVLLALVE